MLKSQSFIQIRFISHYVIGQPALEKGNSLLRVIIQGPGLLSSTGSDFFVVFRCLPGTLCIQQAEEQGENIRE